MMKTFVWVFLFASTLFFAGCRTGGVILRETPLNLSETRRAIVAVIGEPKSISQNGREMTSQYYDKKGKNIDKMDMARERFYTHVTVLGDRRPYDVQVQVLVEGRNEDGGFDLLDRDDDKAAPIAEKIRQSLNQSRDSRNVIDDFRSF
ncbi:hypothetical protein [Bdellovibrio bacteriovorus]|uniref:Lipoprotein n=1 Tax=Bdellovibrio bacteriovorus str. Tiberius TaxID=1069642 RepID=K7YJC6_BDEBC|nr:hypothetical protein [Bdellovibrio bacteriovorus]AFX99760.1 hypothetical protein Bdt_0047 [Bdellovibrio bacteriovorus str. Tiberius]